MGQAVCERHPLVSDSEFRVSMVPLTEREWTTAIEEAVLPGHPDSATAMQLRDRKMTQWVLCYSIREPGDLTQRVYDDPDELLDELTSDDVTFLIDAYYEMIERASPSMASLTEEEIDELKKVWEIIDWNGLSGKSWYALRRFLSTISPAQLTGNSSGSFLIKSLTTMSESPESTPTVSPNSTETYAKSAESQYLT
jgi:hypothetical protein